MDLNDRVTAAQADLDSLVNPSPPISTDNTPTGDDGRPLQRVYITTRSSAPQAQPDEVPYAGSNLSPDAVPATQENIDAARTTNATPSGNQVDGNALPPPTKIDNTDQLLDQRRQQALEALKSGGFDGYTPDVANAKQWDQNDTNSIGQAMQDIGAGFNSSLARTLSLPREVIDRGMGLLGLDFMQHGSAQQNTVDALNRMGIPAYEVENLANKIGRGALPALTTYAAMQLAAPSMAANQGITSLSYMAREMGKWAIKHPVIGLWLGQTQQAGGKIATAKFGENPLTEFAGELAGGMVIPAAAKLATKPIKYAGKAIGSIANTISDFLPTDLENAIKKYNPFYKQPPSASGVDPLVNKNLDLNRIQNFAKDQLHAATSYQDAAIENAINSIPRTGTPAQVQTRTHNLLQDAEKISKRIISGFWDRVPLKARIAVKDMRSDVLAMQRQLVDNDNTRPDMVMNKIIQETAPTRLPNGQFKPAQMSVAKLRDYQSQIGTAITEERAKDAPREGFVRNLAQLSEIIDDNIARQLPNDTTIEQARQMSKRHNDLFSRGPINDILSKRRTGDFRIPQGDSIDTLMQKTDGLAALKAVQDGVSNYPRIPTNRFRPASYYSSSFAVTPAEKQQLDALVKSAEDSIRAGFREAADQGPKKAIAYSQHNEDAIKALSNVAGELAFAAQKVSAALASQKTIAASALARFAETTPEKAVSNIFAQRDPTAVARQLMVSFRGDPDALEGLRNQILDHLIYTVGKGGNPNLIQKMIQEPRIENLLNATLSPDQNARLNRMVNTAVRIGAEDATSLIQKFKYASVAFARVIGAKFGRSLGTGTIQVPGMTAKAGGSFMERQFALSNPQDLLTMAVLDPNWESLLYSRLPTNTRDMRIAQKTYKRIFAVMNSAQQAILQKLHKGDDDE